MTKNFFSDLLKKANLLSVKVTSKIFFAVLIATASFATSCTDKDDEDIVTTVEEDKANIQASFDRISAMFDNVRNSSLFSLVFAEEEYFRYNWVGAGKGDYSWQMGAGGVYVGEGNGDYEPHYNTYYTWVGEGNGSYTRDNDNFVYVGAGNGDYNEIKQISWYEHVGAGNGSYTYDSGKYAHVGVGNGEYTRTQGKEWGASDFIDFTGNILEKLDDKFDLGKSIEDGIDNDRRFNFATLKGKYVYNNSTKSWENSSNNSFLAVFPDKENSSNNNCELALTDYTDKSCDIEGKTTYLPTKIKAHFKKDNTSMIDIDVTANYTQYGIPTSTNAKVYAKPLNIEAGLKQEAAARYSASISIKDETAEVNNLSIACTLSLSKDIDNSKDLSDIFDNGNGAVNSLSFTITQENLKLTAIADIKTLSTSSNPSIVEINNCVNIKVLYNDKEIGELKMDEIDGEKYARLYYKDGTSENTEIYYEKLIDHIEKLFAFD
ncbi:MAG: hypothetical protein LBM08_02390 [Dysgonamonadaceae bacterium]|jgi:hypothetical protein|nr:hypothetical protein [Dysgonamonadaceae bacterium]